MRERGALQGSGIDPDGEPGGRVEGDGATEGRTRWELQALLILCVEEGCFHRWLVPVYPETPHTHKHTLKHTHTRTGKHMLVR